MDKYLICEDSRKAKRPKLKSSEVVVTPLIGSEMDKLIEHQTDDALKAKYMNMKDRVVKDPENGIWNTYWDVSLKGDEHQSIGCIYFDGAPELGNVTVSYDFDSRLSWDRKIAEALRLVTEWALVQKGVYEIHTYLDNSQDGYIRNAERADFVYRELDDGLQHYSKEKPPTSWMGLYLLVGFVAGWMMGYVFSSMIIGMAVAILTSILLGGIMDQKASVEREKYTGQKRTQRRIIAKEKKLAMKKQMQADKAVSDEELTEE